MFQWMIHIVLDAAVMLGAAKMLDSVYMKDFKTSLLVSLGIGLASFLIGWLIIFLLNVVTLGLFALLGLGFIIRIIANGILIEAADRLFEGFETKGILPSFVLAVIIAIAGTLIDWMLYSAAN